MPNYTKLFSTIVTSTIWTEDDKTRIAWITMLALSDQHGEVHASIPGLARVCGISVADLECALNKFLSPDPYSRTEDFEGRRIEKIEGGWVLLNHAKYRKLASKEDAKAANAKRQAAWRERQKRNASVTSSNASVTEGRDIAEAEAEAEEKKTPLTPQGGKERKPRKRFQKPTPDQVDEYGSTLSPPFRRGREFCDFYESKGWKVGSSPMKDWKAAVRTWQAKDKTEAKPQTVRTRL